MQRIPALDGLRALAILAVLGLHTGLDHLGGGFLGVDLFFVLSGFLITSLLTKETSLRNFYLRRSLRIFPPLIAAMALAAVLHPVKPSAIAAGLLFYANFIEWSTLGPVAHLWSLAVEEHFYLAWPLVFLCLGKWRVRALWAAVIASLAVRIALLAHGVENELIYKCSLSRADALAVGCLIALRGKDWQFGGAWTSMLSVIGICACFAFVKWPSFLLLSFGFTAYALLCGIALASLLAGGDTYIKRLLSQPIAQYIGRRSYGLYLYHWPVFMAVQENRLLSGLPLAWVLKVAITFAIAELSYRTIERAAERARSRIGRASPSVLEPSPTASQSPHLRP